MRVLHIDTEKGFRGGERQVLWLMDGLRARGVAQAALVRKGSEFAARVRAAGHQAIDATGTAAWNPLVGRQVRGLIESGFDVVHAHTGNGHSIARTAIGRCAVVVTRRVDFAATGAKYTAPGQHFIAISNAIADILAAGGVARDRIVVVPSGVAPPVDPTPGARARLRAEWAVGPDACVFGTVGSYVDHKDPLNLVEAAAMVRTDLPNARIVFVGEGELRTAMEARVRALGLESTVVLTGWRTDVRDCLDAFDVFVMPSKLEGLCTSLLDAQTVGLPCVACAAGGIPDIITSGENGVLVPPRNAHALAKAMVSLWQDAALRTSYAQRGPAVVRERFSLNAMVEGTLAVYRAALTAGF